MERICVASRTVERWEIEVRASTNRSVQSVRGLINLPFPCTTSRIRQIQHAEVAGRCVERSVLIGIWKPNPEVRGKYKVQPPIQACSSKPIGVSVQKTDTPTKWNTVGNTALQLHVGIVANAWTENGTMYLSAIPGKRKIRWGREEVVTVELCVTYSCWFPEGLQDQEASWLASLPTLFMCMYVECDKRKKKTDLFYYLR